MTDALRNKFQHAQYCILTCYIVKMQAYMHMHVCIQMYTTYIITECTYITTLAIGSSVKRLVPVTPVGV